MGGRKNHKSPARSDPGAAGHPVSAALGTPTHVCPQIFWKKYDFIWIPIAQVCIFPSIFFLSLPGVNTGEMENGDRVNFSLIF